VKRKNGRTEAHGTAFRNADLILALCVLAFCVGVYWPEQHLYSADCTLCCYQSVISSAAPWLLNTATGQLGELSIYDGVLRDTGGTFAFLPITGEVMAIRDTTNRLCRAQLPTAFRPMEQGLFCADCAAQLKSVAVGGYVLLDFAVPRGFRPYPVTADTAYTLWNYSVRIYQKPEEGSLWVEVVEFSSGDR